LALRRQLGLDEDHFVIGKIARLFRLKGHADLLAAFQTILPQIPQARLLLVGDGALRNEIENQVRTLGLQGKVIFTGLVPPGEVPRYVGIMDCLAHLSSREALSRALPQALAAAKPVVAYDFDGADEVCLENETGFLVRTGDIATVANGCSSLPATRAARAPRPPRTAIRPRQFYRRTNGGQSLHLYLNWPQQLEFKLQLVRRAKQAEA